MPHAAEGLPADPITRAEAIDLGASLASLMLSGRPIEGCRAWASQKLDEGAANEWPAAYAKYQGGRGNYHRVRGSSFRGAEIIRDMHGEDDLYGPRQEGQFGISRETQHRIRFSQAEVVRYFNCLITETGAAAVPAAPDQASATAPESPAPIKAEPPTVEPAPMAGGEPAAGGRFRGEKGKVWAAAQRRGRPDFSDRGALTRYVEEIAAETRTKKETVRNYVSKQAELRPDIEKLPVPTAPKKG